MNTTTKPKRRFTGRDMLLIVVGFFALIFLMNAALAYFALGSWPGLLVKNGYDASQSYNQRAEQARIQAVLGWNSTFGISAGRAEFAITDKTGAPVRGLDLTVAAARPTNEAEDRMLEISELPDGTYGGAAALAPGSWVISVLAEDKTGGRHYRRQFRVFVAPQGDGS